ncbi:uncharacterized protein LOC107727387 isoform X2 [Sinocyclocheilus rhinocerous]|uniref:uncharacterized protein LOC107727387 isoform X1 n=1 Tax=Sinocyclocheilus rhinocerous TaxID=307959 RepID=UPI0007BA9105|nr:PREDICTED: uncharacterized protein LOC107727387 isoform X1 [Sinocyclocheilus rhinocerous]XP_016392732.1 PREDICTED: uncharacterized protein LOC107727387 isoform X2 [Sinocyclocheilus rhinocerous]
MSLKRRKPSMVFSWHKSFSILAPWRKGKGDIVLDNDVVLTKMKLLNNVPEKLLNVEDSISTISISMSEQDNTEPLQADEVISVQSAAPETTVPESKTDYLSSIFADSELPRLYKFESEDSGVEMTSGATSPSTPTGSEQSFVVHSRESSCDSGNLNSPVPADNPLEDSSVFLETEQTSCKCAKQDTLTILGDRTKEENVDDDLIDITADSERSEDRTLRNTMENCKDAIEIMAVQEEITDTAMAEDTMSRSQCSIEAYDGKTGSEFQQRPLRKSTTSDSLDEYMEECCRLSEVNQANQSNPLGSGLGYLEHICQLIEKIGQLQEHNLRLQKQICGLQKEGRVIKAKEDFFMQHCSCGAASLAFQELKRHFRSDHYSLTASSSTLSDLSTIPEVTRIPLRTAMGDGDMGCQPALPVSRRGLNRRSYTEGEAKYLSDSAEVLSAPHRRLSENYSWGRVKELVKKTKLRNQSRLGLSSGSLKRSCPQLYRPDVMSAERPRTNRNSMIALGHQKLDYLWPQ